MDKTIESYNKIAETYNEINKHSMWLEEFEFFDQNTLGKKMLDIGCGAGRDAEYFVKKEYDYVGIDASDGMLAIARKRLPNTQFVKMDFTLLDFEPQSFDCFMACASLLHIPKENLPAVLSKIKTVIKPGGVGLITVKEKRILNDGYVSQESRGITRYFSFYEYDEFNEMLGKNGFTVFERHPKTEKDGTPWFVYFVRV
jgi:ubiquinone/menaquinone biosynthesis C-methylase UbiE